MPNNPQSVTTITNKSRDSIYKLLTLLKQKLTFDLLQLKQIQDERVENIPVLNDSIILIELQVKEINKHLHTFRVHKSRNP